MLAVNAIPAVTDERVFWAVLLHDIGKATTTQFIDGRWRAHGHAEQSAAMVPAALGRLNLLDLMEDVSWLVRHHHFALSWGDVGARELSRKQKTFCHHRLFPLLVEVANADAVASQGRSKKGIFLKTICILAEMK